MKPVIIVALAFVLLFSSMSFTLIDFQTANAELKCPSGSFARTNDAGEIICLDNTKRTPVEPIFIPDEVQITDEQMGYIVIGVIILIIIIAGIAKASSKESEPETVVRKGWTELEKEQVRIRQDGKCAKCQRPPPRWEYHHKDEDRSNNSLENCQGLCPNCHSIETHEDGGLD